MSFSNISSLQQIRARINNTLSHGIQIDMSTEESKKLLIIHVNTKTNLVIMFIDINGSTEMSLSLSDDKFSKIIQTFAQEISMP
jgi:adenylate cyclase